MLRGTGAPHNHGAKRWWVEPESSKLIQCVSSKRQSWAAGEVVSQIPSIRFCIRNLELPGLEPLGKNCKAAFTNSGLTVREGGTLLRELGI